MAKTDNTAPVVLKPESTSPLTDIKTMSSKEVAELTGKLHKNVVRDIREMLKELDGSNLSHEEYQELKDVRGYTKEFLLNEELTLTLVSGYSVKMRNAIIKRWKELEAKESLFLGHANAPSATPIALHGCVVLVIHAGNGDWVSVRSLCEVTALDYKWTCRSAVASGVEMSSVPMSGEQIPCFSVAGAIAWLRGIHLDKIQLKKRNRVMTAILQLPDLLLAACEAGRAPEVVPALPDGTRNHTWVVTNSSGREIERVAVSDAAALGKQVGRYFPEQVTLDREAVIGRLDSAVHIMMGASAKLSHELMPLIQTLGTAPDCDDEGVKQFWEKRVAAAGDRLSRVAEGGVA